MVAALPLTILAFMDFIFTKDFMDIKKLKLSYKLTIASVIVGLNTIFVGFCFNPALGKFGNVLSLIISVIVPVSVLI